MEVKAYYKDSNKKLRTLLITDVENEEFTNINKMVMKHLHDTKEHYFNPIMYVFKGGKADGKT